MPPIVVEENDNDTVDTLVPNTPERCVLIRMNGLPGNALYEAHLLMGRISGARFVTLDTELELVVEDLEDEEIIPVVGGATYPTAGMPLYAFEVLNEAVLAPLRARARLLLEIHGALPTAAAMAGASWVINDTAHQRFGQAVSAQTLGTPGCFISQTSYGLVFTDSIWVSVEQVRDGDITAWKAEKHRGVGRDARLLPSSVSEAWTDSEVGVAPSGSSSPRAPLKGEPAPTQGMPALQRQWPQRSSESMTPDDM